MTTLRTRIRNIQVVERHILHNLLLFVDVAFRNWDVLLSLQVILSGIVVAAADSLNCARGRFNVDDIADSNLLFLNVLVDGRV